MDSLQTKIKEPKIELCKEVKDRYFIRKGLFKQNGVVANLTIKDLAILMVKINRVMLKIK
jgi:hypothetical protein